MHVRISREQNREHDQNRDRADVNQNLREAHKFSVELEKNCREARECEGERKTAVDQVAERQRTDCAHKRERREDDKYDERWSVTRHSDKLVSETAGQSCHDPESRKR